MNLLLDRSDLDLVQRLVFLPKEKEHQTGGKQETTDRGQNDVDERIGHLVIGVHAAAAQLIWHGQTDDHHDGPDGHEDDRQDADRFDHIVRS